MTTIGQELRHPAAEGPPRLAGGFISAELAAAAAAASIFAPDALLGCGRVAAWCSEPPARLLPPALEPAWPGT